MVDWGSEEAGLRAKALDVIRASDVRWERAIHLSPTSYRTYYKGFIVTVNLGFFWGVDVKFTDEHNDSIKVHLEGRDYRQEAYNTIEDRILLQENEQERYNREKEKALKEKIFKRL